METGCLSFYMSFLDHLHHLIIWQGGFDCGLGPICSGTDWIPLWAKMFYWVCAPIPFIRQRFVHVPWAYVMGLCMCCSLPHHYSIKIKLVKFFLKKITSHHVAHHSPKSMRTSPRCESSGMFFKVGVLMRRDNSRVTQTRLGQNSTRVSSTRNVN